MTEKWGQWYRKLSRVERASDLNETTIFMLIYPYYNIEMTITS